MMSHSLLGVVALMAPLVFDPAKTDEPPSEQDVVSGAVNASYELSGERIRLRSGMLKQRNEGHAASLVLTSMWGAPALGDLNGDGRQDAALILMREGNGGRTLYYVAACLSRRYHKRCKGTMAVLLGDRISPHMIAIRDRAVVVSFAARGKDDPVGTPPSVGVTKKLRVRNGLLTR